MRKIIQKSIRLVNQKNSRFLFGDQKTNLFHQKMTNNNPIFNEEFFQKTSEV